MLKNTAFLLFLIISPISIFAQDWVPVISSFRYNASECELAFSCYVKNIDDNSDADPTAFRIIIFNISDNSEIFSADVPLDQIKLQSSSPSKSWTMDLPALAGYRPDVSYKIAVIANTNEKFEFDKKNNRVESAQFACGSPALNNAPAKQAGGGSGNSEKTAAPADPAADMKDLAQNVADMKASRDQMMAANKASQEEEKQRLTSKVDNLRQKVAKRTAERDQYAHGTKDWSDLSYEVADLEFELKISETELEKATDELAYGQEGLSKSEKERYKTKLSKLESQQSENKKNQKNGLVFGEAQDAKTAPAQEEKHASPDKEAAKSTEKNPEEEEEKGVNKHYTAEEIALLSTFDLKRMKLDYNTLIGRRKLKLKTKSSFLSPAEKVAIQAEIDELTKQVEFAEAELVKREK